MGSPETRISDSESCFVLNILVRVEIEDGGEKAKVSCCCLGSGCIGDISRFHVGWW